MTEERITTKKNTSRARFIVMAAGVLAFAAVAAAVMCGATESFDDGVRFFFYDLRSESLTVVARIITYMGNWQSIVALCLILLIIKPTRIKYGIPVSAAALFVTIANKVIKMLAERPRPDEMYRLIEEDGFSFASGHAITSMCVFGLLIYLVRRNFHNRAAANVLTVVLLIPAVTIGVSRVYLGVHYPTDVLAGWCLAIAVIAADAEITERLRKRRKA